MSDWFIYEGEDLVYKVEYDSERASGDGWHEPHTSAHAWIYKLWYATKPTFEKRERVAWDSRYTQVTQHTAGDGWVEMDPNALRPALRVSIEDECMSYAFPEREDA